MSESTMNAPRDKYSAVWIIFFTLGLGTLLPWNFFMTATMYFTSRLKEPQEFNSLDNHTDAMGGRNLLEAKFNNVMTLCSMLPLLTCTALNSFLHARVPQKVRVLGSLLVILSVFVVTAALVKVPLEPLPFFIITMVMIVIINSFGAVLQGSLFGMAAALPASYTTPIMSGQGLAGTFAAVAMICAIASGSELHDAAFGYFLTACAVILLSVISYLLLPKLDFYLFHQNSGPQRSAVEEPLTSVNLHSPGLDSAVMDQKPQSQNVSMIGIFKKIWSVALSVCFTFTITIGTFPAITADTRSTLAAESSWNVYFIPVCCFLFFNLSDWGGRSLSALCTWPGMDSWLVPALVVARVVFVPLFMLCNVQPRFQLPIFFHHDGWFILFMVLFAFSNGYLASLCMCFGPKKVLPHEAESAGVIMAFFLTLGLALGAGLSFLFRALV
ncbi:equilibrative nucleoside transporter 1-like isoform 1-T2 [Synchiropus picturatus]